MYCLKAESLNYSYNKLVLCSNAITAAAANPATTSSIMIPNPPLMFLSNQLMGQGFKISNSRKRQKPTMTFTYVAGKKAIVIQKPTNSSHTIPPWSWTPSLSAAEPQIKIPTIAQIATISIYIGSGNCANRYQSGIAARVPMVPGALAESPAPKPKASTRTGERITCEKLGLTAKVIKTPIQFYCDIIDPYGKVASCRRLYLPNHCRV